MLPPQPWSVALLAPTADRVPLGQGHSLGESSLGARRFIGYSLIRLGRLIGGTGSGRARTVTSRL